MEEKGLIVAAELNAVEVFTGPQGVEKILADIENQVLEFVPDTATVKGRKDIASLAYKVSQSKVVLDELGKGLVSDWKAKSALVDASRKIARDRLDELRDKARLPLTIWEEQEAVRVASEKLAAEIEVAHFHAIQENELFDRKREIERKEAEFAKIEAEKQAAIAAEKAATEKREYEERIAKEAAEKAKREAEESAQAAIKEAERKVAEAQAAVEKAERDRISAEEKAKADQAAAVAAAEEKARIEAARIETERVKKEQEEKSRIEADRKETERKAADIEHRRSVNKSIIHGLVTAGLTEEQAKSVITAIVGGLINNITINY